MRTELCDFDEFQSFKLSLLLFLLYRIKGVRIMAGNDKVLFFSQWKEEKFSQGHRSIPDLPINFSSSFLDESYHDFQLFFILTPSERAGRWTSSKKKSRLGEDRIVRVIVAEIEIFFYYSYFLFFIMFTFSPLPDTLGLQRNPLKNWVDFFPRRFRSKHENWFWVVQIELFQKYSGAEQETVLVLKRKKGEVRVKLF